MKAFINTPITKEQFVDQLKWHQRQDSFVSGTYWDFNHGKFFGCAVACSLRSIQQILKLQTIKVDHALYEKFLGVPEWLAVLEDEIFENVSDERKKTWPVEFGEAIQVGSDLEKIKHPFLIFLMEENLEVVNSLEFDRVRFQDVESEILKTEKAIELTITYLKNPTESARSAAWSAAMSASESARSAAISASDSASESAMSAAWSAAMSASESASESARSAAARSAAWSAWSAWSTARSAAWSAAMSAWSTARSAWSASMSAARSAAYDKYADKLLELMRNCQ